MRTACRLVVLSAFLLMAGDAAAQRVLVFSKTNGYRHSSIEAGYEAFRTLAAAEGWCVTFSEDSLDIRAAALDTTDVLVFLNSTGDVFGTPEEAALKAFVAQGGGVVGVHSATDTEKAWPYFNALLSAVFANHPDIQPARLRVVDTSHPATAGLPTTWVHRDEWYNFRAPLPPQVTVLMTVDERSYEGGTMGDPHPITWTNRIGEGRVFYTALGHTPETYAETWFRNLLAGGVRWAAAETTD